MDQNWFIWRPIIAKLATLQEIESHWSINDLVDCHEWLDAKEDVEQKELDRVKRKRPR